VKRGLSILCLAGFSALALEVSLALPAARNQGLAEMEEAPAGGPCLPEPLLRGARIVALGAYQGGLPTKVTLSGAENEVKAIAVTANASGPPLVLVLAAYDPVVWEFSGFPRGRLRALIVYGYDRQAVAHLPDPIPVRSAIGPESDGSCGGPLFAYEGGARLEALDGQVRKVLGRPIESFTGRYDPGGLDVEGGSTAAAPNSNWAGASNRKPLPRVPDPVGPHEAEIQQLVREGAIRPARKEDVEAWNASATRRSPTGHLAPVRAKSISLGRGLVVLRAISLPAGMHGYDSRDFIIPPGVPMPIDAGSFNAYYFIADGTCRAPGDEC
jgi:hypothetical protein